jgi:drug/metabolite transporter (DMT)-like permease
MASPTSTTADARRREREGALMCTFAATLFAAAIVMGKLGHDAGAPTTMLLAVRFALAAPLLWLVAARRGAVRAIARRDALVAFALGFIYAAQTEVMFTAIVRIGVSLAELLSFVYPAIVVLGAIALGHEAFSRRRLAALALSLAGVALVLTGSGTGALEPLGVALSLAAGALYAGYVLAAGRVGKGLPAATFAALLCSGAAVAFATVGGASGTLRFDVGAEAWAWALALALGSTALAITAFIGGVARLGPGRASILATLEPPFACVLAFLLLGERLTVPQLLGGALVVSASLVLQVRSVRSRGRDASAQAADHPPARALAHDAAGC